MAPDRRDGGSSAPWLVTRQEPPPLRRYYEMLLERWWIVAAVLALTTLAAIVYIVRAPKVYEAGADVLVTSISSEDVPTVGLGLIREGSDPTRDTETAARLVANVSVAARVGRRLDLSSSPDDVLRKVSVEPVAQSNIVSITARDEDPAAARALANGFGRVTIALRTRRLHRQLDTAIERLQKRIEDDPTVETGAVEDQLATLETLRTGPDPTLRFETPATLPTSPISPKPAIAIAAAVASGLLLGVAAALGLSVLDPRFRRERQLRAHFRLPVLARVPRPRDGLLDRARSRARVSRAGKDAYRGLAWRLHLGRERGSKTILVAPASDGEEGSATALNLASALAAAGRDVILVGSRPAPLNGSRLSRDPTQNGGLGAALSRAADLEDCLVHSPGHNRRLRFLVPEFPGAEEGLADPAAGRLLSRAKHLADVVVVDSPLLTSSPEMLSLADKVDEVLIVVRRGRTRLPELAELAELLSARGIRPAGFTVVGSGSGRGERVFDKAIERSWGLAWARH